MRTLKEESSLIQLEKQMKFTDLSLPLSPTKGGEIITTTYIVVLYSGNTGNGMSNSKKALSNGNQS